MELDIKDFKLPKDLERYRKAVREFVLTDLEAISEKMEDTLSTPKELVPKLAKAGLLSLTFPKRLGGYELTPTQFFPILEEVAGSAGAIRLIVHTWDGIYSRQVLEYGSEYQIQKYMAPMAVGKACVAWSLTEPNAGTGVDIKTTAVKKGKNYILNGRKHLVSLAGIADTFTVFAYTDKAKKGQGISAFLVEKGFPGFIMEKMSESMGLRGSIHGDFTFKDCVVPAVNLIGKEGAGLDSALELLDLSRVSIGISCVGTAQRLLDLSTEYAKKRVTFGKPIASRQAVQGILADMATDVAAARALCYDSARKYEAKQPIRKEGAMCKLYGLNMVRRVSDRALEVHGGIGFFRSLPVERLYRDARAMWLEEGAPTIQRQVIAKELLD